MRRGAARAKLEREYRDYLVALVDRPANCVRCHTTGQIWSSAANGVVCATCYRALVPGGTDEGTAAEPPEHISFPQKGG
jgi:ribosomal protein S27E